MWCLIEKIKYLLLRHLAGRDGFSMTELMVSAGLVGGLALATSMLIENNVNADKIIKADATVVALQRDIIKRLDSVNTYTNASACLNTFAGINPASAASFAVTSIRDSASFPGNVVFSAGQKFESNRIELTRMQLDTWTPVSASSPNTGHANLSLVFNNVSTGKVAASQKTKTRNITIQISRDPSTGIITKCGASDPAGGGSITTGADPYWDDATEVDEIWHDTSGSLPYIAINATTSAYPLTVNGTIEMLSSGGIKYPDGSVQKSAETWKKSGNNIYFDGGSVGIGVDAMNIYAKLEVQKKTAIRIGRTYVSSGGDNDCGYLGGNVWYDGSNYVIPDDSNRSAFLRLCFPEIGLFNNATAGSTTFTQRFGIDASHVITPGGGSGITNCTRRILSGNDLGAGLTISCVGAELRMGGGCRRSSGGSGSISGSYPTGINSWFCKAYLSDGWGSGTEAYVVCCT